MRENRNVAHSIPRTHGVDVKRFPEMGDASHAKFSQNGNITILHSSTSSGSIGFDKTPRLPVGTRIEAIVLSISTMSVNHLVTFADAYHFRIGDESFSLI